MLFPKSHTLSGPSSGHTDDPRPHSPLTPPPLPSSHPSPPPARTASCWVRSLGSFFCSLFLIQARPISTSTSRWQPSSLPGGLGLGLSTPLAHSLTHTRASKQPKRPHSFTIRTSHRVSSVGCGLALCFFFAFSHTHLFPPLLLISVPPCCWVPSSAHCLSVGPSFVNLAASPCSGAVLSWPGCCLTRSSTPCPTIHPRRRPPSLTC